MLLRPGTGERETIKLKGEEKKFGKMKTTIWESVRYRVMSNLVFHFLLKAMVFNTKQPAGLPKEAQGAVLSLNHWPLHLWFTITHVVFEENSQL